MKIIRNRRREILYHDWEMIPWFVWVCRGYTFKTACSKANLDWSKLKDTFDSDDDVMAYALNLSIYGSGRIREGTMPVPNRRDGLFDKYRVPAPLTDVEEAATIKLLDDYD
jgi:hypothetical protein